MAENTKENPESVESIRDPKPTADEEVDSARILFQEELFDEAKKLLHQVLIRHPHFSRAKTLLSEIQASELNALLNRNMMRRVAVKPLESPELVLRKLEKDLGLLLQDPEKGIDPALENWNHETRESPRDAFDLGVAFFEMGCYRDAIVELKEVLKRVRIERTELGELGVAAAALCAEAMIELNEGFEAKSFLLPILNEPELNHETRIPLFYLVGRADELLGNPGEARLWFKRVVEADPLFRDAGFRIRLL